MIIKLAMKIPQNVHEVVSLLLSENIFWKFPGISELKHQEKNAIFSLDYQMFCSPNFSC